MTILYVLMFVSLQTQTESTPSMPSVPADSIMSKSGVDATVMENDSNADIAKPSHGEQDVLMEQQAEDMPRGKSPEPTPRNQFPTTDETTAEYRANDLGVIGPEDGVDTSDMEMVTTREVSLESVRGTARAPAPGQQPPASGNQLPPASGTELERGCQQWDQKVDKFPLYESAVYDSLYEKEYPPPTYRLYSVDNTIPKMPGSSQPLLPHLASDGAEGADIREGAEGDQPPVSTDDVDVGWVDDQANVQHQGETEQHPDQVKGQSVEEHYEPDLHDQEKQDQEQPEKEHLAHEHEPRALSLVEQQLQLEHDHLIRQQQQRRENEQMSQEMLHEKQAHLEQHELMHKANKQQNKSNTSVPPVEDNLQPISEVELIYQSPSTPAADTTDQHLNHDELREDMPRSRSPEPHPPHNFPTSDEKTPQYRARAMSLIGPEDGMSSSDLEMVPKEGSHGSIKATAKTSSTGRLEDKRSIPHHLPPLTEDTTNMTSSKLSAITGNVRESHTDNSHPLDSVRDERLMCVDGIQQIQCVDNHPTDGGIEENTHVQGAESNIQTDHGGDFAEKVEGADGGGKPPESGGDVPAEHSEEHGCRCPCQPLDLSQVMGAEIGRHTSEELLARVIRQAMYRVDTSDVTPDPSPAGTNRRSV